jgi:hypothetical protein
MVVALRRDRDTRRTRFVQVRATEVETGGDDPRLVLRDQGRVPNPQVSKSADVLPDPTGASGVSGLQHRAEPPLGSERRAWIRCGQLCESDGGGGEGTGPMDQGEFPNGRRVRAGDDRAELLGHKSH